MVNKTNLLRGIEIEFDEHNIEDATAHRNDLQRQVLVTAGALLGMLLLAILFAWIVARSMARSLRELRHGALTVAQYGLPQAVQRLRDPALAGQMSPHQLALQIAEPLPVRSRDEFGQVAEAFNAVHLEAVRTAAEQAALRASVATMFVNLARRSQILVDRLIGHLDRLERGEEDPDRLAELFQLDHLATRMRRNDENLLVLAGADSTRIQREPAPLMDVLRAAQSEVEHYTRIEFGMIDRDIEIAAHAVNDMVHLVAELLDNATAFSPPDSAVIVEARRVGDRSVLLVEDHGIGVSPEQLNELNERLANPPMVDVAVSRMMGLVVVARLAARHGVKVELRAARERGTIADMTLPAGVLVPRALSGRANAGMPTAGHACRRPERLVQARPIPSTPAPRSPLGLAAGAGKRSGTGRRRQRRRSALRHAHQQRPVRRRWAHTGERPTVNGFANGCPAPAGDAARGQRAASVRPAQRLPRRRRLRSGSFRSGPGTVPRRRLRRRSAPVRVRPAPARATVASAVVRRSARTRSQPARLVGPDRRQRRGDQGRQSPGDLNPLPQRRANENWAVDGEVAETRSAARSRGSGPRSPARVATTPPRPYAAGGPPPAAAAPPAWPPVSPAPGRGVRTAADRYAAAAAQQADAYAQPQAEAYPPVDMTAEIPRVRLDWDPSASDSDAGDSRQRFVDETMELPIFRELESAWFQTTASARPSTTSLSPPRAGPGDDAGRRRPRRRRPTAPRRRARSRRRTATRHTCRRSDLKPGFRREAPRGRPTGHPAVRR